MIGEGVRRQLTAKLLSFFMCAVLKEEQWALAVCTGFCSDMKTLHGRGPAPIHTGTTVAAASALGAWSSALTSSDFHWPEFPESRPGTRLSGHYLAGELAVHCWTLGHPECWAQ